MTTYAKITDGTIEHLSGRPRWFDDAGQPVSDELLAEHGWLPVVFEVPEHDPVAERIVMLSEAQWLIEASRVVVPYIVTPIPFEELRQAAIERVNAAYTEHTGQIAQGYPDYERESWPVQIEEANARLADEMAETPWIDAAASMRGITSLELARRIKANDIAYRKIHGALSGIRQGLEDRINVVPDDEHAAAAFAAIQWPEGGSA